MKALTSPAYSGDNFTAIRLLAALLVLFGHAFPLTGSVAPAYLGNPVSTLAVKIFFVVSGFMISGSWLSDPDPYRYLNRRILRIFPGLITLTLLTVLLVGPAISVLPAKDYYASDLTWLYFYNAILFPVYSLPGVFTSNTYPNAVNGSLWTLPVEFFMYLVTPSILYVSRQPRILLVFTILISAVSVWLTRVHVPEQPIVVWGSSIISGLEMVPYYLWGIVYRTSLSKYLNLQWALLLAVALPMTAQNWPMAEIVSLLLVPYCTLALGLAAKPVLSAAGRYGDISYGVYLYGFLVQQIVALYLPFSGAWANFVQSLFPVLLCGYLSWKLVEEPMMRLKPKKAQAAVLS